jgi:hypothetical protein
VGETVADGAVVVVVVVVLDGPGPPDSPSPQAVNTAAEMAAEDANGRCDAASKPAIFLRESYPCWQGKL